MRFFIVLAFSVILSACGMPESGARPTVFCTLEARVSVQVTVADPQGNVVEDARVTFTLNGGPEQQAECEFPSSASGGCRAWAAEHERAGDFTVTATSADGKRTARQQVSVGQDECHVLTEAVTIALPSAP